MHLIIIVIPIIAGAGLVLLLGSGLLSRGKKLKCPACGAEFAAPAFDEKVSGLGWTFPYTGLVKCPRCGEKRSRRDYLKPEVYSASSASA